MKNKKLGLMVLLSITSLVYGAEGRGKRALAQHALAKDEVWRLGAEDDARVIEAGKTTFQQLSDAKRLHRLGGVREGNLQNLVGDYRSADDAVKGYAVSGGVRRQVVFNEEGVVAEVRVVEFPAFQPGVGPRLNALERRIEELNEAIQAKTQQINTASADLKAQLEEAIAATKREIQETTNALATRTEALEGRVATLEGRTGEDAMTAKFNAFLDKKHEGLTQAAVAAVFAELATCGIVKATVEEGCVVGYEPGEALLPSTDKGAL